MTRNRSLILMGTLAATMLAPFFATSARAEDAAPQGTGLAVLNFRVASTVNYNKGLGEDLSDSTTNALTQTLKGKALRAIERMRLNDVLGELKISDTGIVDPNEATRIGKAAGARYVLLGSVTDADVIREDDAKRLDMIGTNFAAEFGKNFAKGAAAKVFGLGNSQPKQPGYVTVVSIEARIVSLAEADGEASYKVIGYVKNKTGKQDFARAVADAADKLAKRIAKSVTSDGRIDQSLEESKDKEKKDKKGEDGQEVVVPSTSTPAGAGKIEGRILDSESADEVALKLNKNHGLKAGQKFKMRWVQAVGGDASVRKTKRIYLVEIVEADTGGVILKITATEKGEGLPGENETVILEPEK